MRSIIVVFCLVIFNMLFANEIILPTDDIYLTKPRSVELNNQYIFVVDEGNNCFFRIDKDNNNIMKIGSLGHGPGELSSPDYLTVRDSLVFVNNRNNGNISIYKTKGEFIRNLKIVSFGFVVDKESKYIYSIPSYNSNFEYLIDKFSLEGEFIESLVKDKEQFKTDSDFYKKMGTMDIDNNYLYFSYMFYKYEILKVNLETKIFSSIEYPKKLHIKKPDINKKNESSGIFIVNSDIKLMRDNIYILSIMDNIYAAKTIDVFAKKGDFLYSFILRDEKIKEEEIENKDCFVFFTLDNEFNFFFVDLVYNATLKKIKMSELIKK